jgi:glutamyl-tRNA synthetase
MKERVTFPQDFWREAAYFFIAPETYNEQVAAKKWNAQSVNIFEQFKNELPGIEVFIAEEVKNLLNSILERNGMKLGMVMQALRLAITGVEAGPDLMAIIEIIGKEETVKRLETAIEKLQPFALKTV